MKGIILAGGTCSRLFPVTKAVSKQLLPVYDKPMVYYPLSVLMLAGIRDILVISTPRDLPVFENLFGDGSTLGMHFEYRVQETPRGLADAFIVGKEFIGSDDVALVLGDNIFYGQSFTSFLQKARKTVETEKKSVIFGYRVNDAASYGVLSFDASGNVTGLEEKPAVPASDYAVPGLYFYPNDVVSVASTVQPSARGELEITSVNEAFLSSGRLSVQLLGRGMTWLDMGTYDGLLEASNFIATIQKRQGLYVACIEEIAFRNGWISRDTLLELARGYKTEYGRYLELVAGS